MTAAAGLGCSTLVASAAHADPSAPDVPDVVVASPSGGDKVFFPDATMLADGRLVTVFYQAPSHSRYDGKYMWTESIDEGANWSTPRTLIDTPLDDRDAQITQLSDGTIIVNFFRMDWTNEATTGIVPHGSWVIRSGDGGITWSQPVPVNSSMSCGCGPVSGAYPLGWNATTGKILELDSGDLLVPLYGTRSDSAVGQASVVRSTDGGLTWPIENESMIPIPSGVSLSEIAITKTAGDGVEALIRTAGPAGPTYSSRSIDGGATWSVPEQTTMKGQAHHLLTLQDGRLLATYGDRSRQFVAGEPVAGRIREVCGTWNEAPDLLLFRVMSSDDQGDPSTVELSGSRFFTVSYDTTLGIVGTYSSLSDYDALPPVVTPGGPISPPQDSILNLTAMRDASELSFTTDLQSGHANHPETKPSAALDGVAKYWYSALGGLATPASPKEYTVNFVTPQTIDWIGLNLKVGYPESVEISFSQDGVNWELPVQQRTETSVANKIEWQPTPEATIRAIRVKITDSFGGSAMLSELNLAHEGPGVSVPLQPHVSVTPSVLTSAAFRGSGVRVSGAGYPAGQSLSVLLDGVQITTATTSECGVFSVPLVVQGASIGVHTLVVSDGTNSAQTKLELRAESTGTSTLELESEGE
ncbi:exo-alpha-sialidase [Leucobacter sp. UT-8R-CII-1-4]|uniref:exo-alpha-sialidase n=1 Tax=Leucobacter sp. UT-8R-CII-1-4 TaxID=3040075 RepID=UPI0024A8C2B9|nr:exo-alpha-sialidase [Leucobacter sp. UT-8R-CII-1-4]MDI6023420.1 exo-alpha-sialidase [Leucobacter sp. UT-8R-CII-1-4]